MQVNLAKHSATVDLVASIHTLLFFLIEIIVALFTGQQK